MHLVRLISFSMSFFIIIKINKFKNLGQFFLILILYKFQSKYENKLTVDDLIEFLITISFEMSGLLITSDKFVIYI